jgi:hypothetical protein
MERSRVVERSLVAERSRSRVAEQSRSQADQHDTPYVIEDNIHVFMAFFFSLDTNMPRMDTNFTTLTWLISDRSESREINCGRRSSEGDCKKR